jgi:acetylglutamate kinase
LENLYIIKIGGNIIDDDNKLSSFLKDFAAITGKKILVHGGGKLATKLAADLGIQQQLVDGRRITDGETLKIVTMVYAGFINKNIVARLQARGCDAVGICGADGNAILAHKRAPSAQPGGGDTQGAAQGATSGPATSQGEAGTGASGPGIDYGYVGDVDKINAAFLASLLQQGKSLVFAPITHDGKGQLLNTNADTIAQELARGLSGAFGVSLVYSFEKSGVLLNAEDDSSVIRRINPSYYRELKERQVVFAGMIPKLDNAFTALRNGVRKVIIGRAEDLPKLLAGQSGTTIVHE